MSCTYKSPYQLKMRDEAKRNASGEGTMVQSPCWIERRRSGHIVITAGKVS